MLIGIPETRFHALMPCYVHRLFYQERPVLLENGHLEGQVFLNVIHHFPSSLHVFLSSSEEQLGYCVEDIETKHERRTAPGKFGRQQVRISLLVAQAIPDRRIRVNKSRGKHLSRIISSGSGERTGPSALAI